MTSRNGSLPWSQLQCSMANVMINRSAIDEIKCSFPFVPKLMDILQFLCFLFMIHTHTHGSQQIKSEFILIIKTLARYFLHFLLKLSL